MDKQTLFDFWSKSYDILLPSVFYQAIHQRILDYTQLPEGATVLDLGCGTGKLLNRLAQHYPSLTGTGLDFSSEMLKQAQIKSYDSNRLTYVQGAADAIPLRQNQYDAVFCTVSFLHYPDPLTVLREVYRVLKPSGRFYLADYIPPAWMGQAQLDVPVWAGNIHFYSPVTRKSLGEKAELVLLDNHYLFGPIMLTIFAKEAKDN